MGGGGASAVVGTSRGREGGGGEAGLLYVFLFSTVPEPNDTCLTLISHPTSGCFHGKPSLAPWGVFCVCAWLVVFYFSCLSSVYRVCMCDCVSRVGCPVMKVWVPE
jgi:hypothetical protein